MINANEDHPNIKFFIYMDSDAVIDRSFANVPLNRMIQVSLHIHTCTIHEYLA